MFRGVEQGRLVIKKSLPLEQQNSTGAGIASCVEVQIVAVLQEAFLLVQTLMCFSGLWFLVAFSLKILCLDVSNFFLLEETLPYFMRKHFVLDERSGMNVRSSCCQCYHLFVCVLLCLSLISLHFTCFTYISWVGSNFLT